MFGFGVIWVRKLYIVEIKQNAEILKNSIMVIPKMKFI